MEFEGKVLQIFPARGGVSKAGNAWTSQDVLFEVQTQSQYPRRTLVNFFNKEEEVKRLTEGTLYTVSIDIDAREYNGRWYNDVRAWRVQPKQPVQPQPQPAPAADMAPMPTEQDFAVGGASTASAEVDDLPF